MALNKPQQRIPLCSVVINGVEHEATISEAWYKVLNSFFLTLGGMSASASVPDVDAGLQYDVREADWAELAKRVIDLERDQWGSASPADVARVAARVDNLAGDEPVHLLAQIAELSKRVADLETELAASVNLHAQVAQLAAQIKDLQTETAFT